MPISPEYLHLVKPGPFPAFLYGRASHDPSKKGRSVDTQMDEGREICLRYAWPIVGEYTDIDRSASRHKKREREEFEEMLDAIPIVRPRILVAWEASRYYRDLQVYLRVRDACAEHGVLLCYNGTIYDLSERADRRATAEDALRAEDEAEGIRDRNLRTQRKLVSSGRPTGRTPYGYTRRYDPKTGDLIDQVPHPVRARYVKQMFARFVAGKTTYSIAAWLNSQPDAANPSGALWDQGRVVDQLRMIAYIGHRVHHGVDVGKADWPPLVTELTFRQAQRILDQDSRRKQRDTSVKHLLSHLAICGECDDAPWLKGGKRNGRRGYYCSGPSDVNINADVLEAYVEEAVLTWLKSPEAADAFRNDDVAAAAEADAARLLLIVLQEQLEEARAAATRFKAGVPELSIASLSAMEASLGPQIQEAKDKVRQATGVPPLLRQLLGHEDVEARWAGLLLEQQRSVLRDVVTVRLHRAHVKGAQKLVPGRITLAFVGQPGFRGGSRPGRPARPAGGLGTGTE